LLKEGGQDHCVGSRMKIIPIGIRGPVLLVYYFLVIEKLRKDRTCPHSVSGPHSVPGRAPPPHPSGPNHLPAPWRGSGTGNQNFARVILLCLSTNICLLERTFQATLGGKGGGGVKLKEMVHTCKLFFKGLLCGKREKL
jgi:hypothetical protein